MKKVFLFCVDALEYDTVAADPEAYPNLAQSQYYKVEIPERTMTVLPDGTLTPWSPVMWEAIFTGRIKQKRPQPRPERESWEEWRNPLINYLKYSKASNWLYSKLVKNGLLNKGLPAKLGFKRKKPLEKGQSILTLTADTILIHHPLVCRPEFEVKGLYDGYSLQEIADSNLEAYKHEKAVTLEKLREDWTLFILYTRLLDLMGHLYWHDQDKMKYFYREVDLFSSRIKKQLPDDTLFIICSDHGMQDLKASGKGGMHSHHAYLSLSKPIELLDPDITETYQIVKEALAQ